MGEAAPGTWFYPEGGRLRGAALVLHGLNLDPLRMQPLIALLNAAGIAAFNAALRGHGGNFTSRPGSDARRDRMAALQACRYAHWAEEALSGYREVRRLAAAAGCEACFVGFSYGALLGCDLLVSRPEVAFARMVLLAPALRLRPWDRAIRLLSPFPSLVLPTPAPEGYPANPGTPVAAYNALFETLEHFEARLGPRLNIPTLVFVDPGDELVSAEGLRQLVAAERLERWRIHPLRVSRPVLAGALRHLILDEERAGRRAWAELRGVLHAFLGGSPEGGRGVSFSSRQNPDSGV
ncbi:MAG: alpha/beta hydrolase [Desulfobacterales bacterium]